MERIGSLSDFEDNLEDDGKEFHLKRELDYYKKDHISYYDSCIH